MSKSLVGLEQSELAGPSVYLTVMSSSNTPESGAVSKIAPSSRCIVGSSPPNSTTVDPIVITPLCAVSPPAVASTTDQILLQRRSLEVHG